MCGSLTCVEYITYIYEKRLLNRSIILPFSFPVSVTDTFLGFKHYSMVSVPNNRQNNSEKQWQLKPKQT